MYRAFTGKPDEPTEYMIETDAFGFLMDKAPGAPDLQVAEVEYGENETVRIEVTPQDYVFEE